MALLRSSKHSNGVIAMAVFVFMLTAVPKLNLRVGPVPLYLIDLVIVLLLFYASRRPSFSGRPRPFGTIVIMLCGFSIASEMVGLLITGAVFEHVYLMTRFLLAFSVFYVTGQLIRTVDDLEIVLKAAAAGVIVTSLMMILTSLPMTRGIVSSLVLSNSFFDPAGPQSIRLLTAGDAEGGVRGRTLVGVSILGATFINLSWPLAALLLAWPNKIGKWRRVAMIACFLAPLGVLMSYSRGPILGTILIVLLVLFFGLRHVRKGIMRPVIIGACLVALVGVNSNIFFFDRLTNRTTAIFEAPLDDARESERLLSYIGPFEHLAEHPRNFILGEGLAIKKADRNLASSAGRDNHAMFSAVYYAHGMIAALVYFFLVLAAIFYAYRHANFRETGPGAYLSHAVFASAIGLLPWIAFGHAMISQPRGAMMFFFVLGLLTTLRHFPIQTPAPNLKETGHAHSRPVAV